MKRITLATIKSFIKKNSGKLFIQTKSSFDGMVDGCVSNNDRSFSPALSTDLHVSNTLGIQGAWFVGGSRNSLTAFDDGEYIGYSIYNCCGSFVLAIEKEESK